MPIISINIHQDQLDVVEKAALADVRSRNSFLIKAALDRAKIVESTLNG